MDDPINNSINAVADSTYNYVNTLLINPSVIMLIVLVLIIYLALFMSLGENNNMIGTASTTTTTPLTTIFLVFFILLVIINGLQYLYGFDIMANIKNLLTGNPEVDIIVDASREDAINAPVPEIMLRPQVFNIPGNDYVYQDAKALCSAYGSRLATYAEVEDAYKNGGDWCNYGWSDGQMALFPTQQKTFDNLQKIEGHKNDCGRPGVNGGYMANPGLKFGVNCYGYKPRMTPTEEELMATEPLYPKTEKDILMEKRVNYWKNKLSEILVSPFNSSSWSRI